jgi:AraC-like DNA-binding protein
VPAKLPAIHTGRLERSCGPAGDTVRLGTGAGGVERVEAFFGGRAFEPHRHDTYAIGITTRGVQLFRYRGAQRVCLPGQLHFLHPDEIHDGVSGTGDGFGYRIVYVEPWLVQAALGGRPLPFVRHVVQDPSPATVGLAALLAGMDEPADDVWLAGAAATIAGVLCAAAGQPETTTTIDLKAVSAVREYLAAHPAQATRADVLEHIAGIDRWTLARQFRAAFGTSPDRYRTMLRLRLARAAIASGMALADAAASCGFADQSHMTRHFKRAFGLTPGRWAAVTGDRRPERAGSADPSRAGRRAAASRHRSP